MLNELYLRSPRELQNFGLSLYGAKVYRERFCGKIPIGYSLSGSPFAEATESDFEFQNDRLKELIEHCVNYVPYYRKILEGTDWKDINPNNIGKYIPTLKKSTILSDPASFLSSHPSFQKNRITLNTSGSSGTPLVVYSTAEARRINYYYYEKVLQHFGTSYRARSTTLAGRLLYNQCSKSCDRYDRFNRTQYLSSYNISEDTILQYISALNSWRPEFIDSYPSALTEIVAFARAKNIEVDFLPKLIITSSETLAVDARHSIESYFGTKVVDHYGCTEMAISAFSDGNKYYVNPRFSLVETESLGDDQYSLITSGLLNFAMPLIRYEIGDCVNLVDSSKPYTFSSVVGRIDDVIVTPEGRRVGRIDPAFKGVVGVDLAQVIQEDANSILIRIVLSKECVNEFDKEQLIKNIKDRTSHTMSVSIKYEESIEKGSNGKFKSVVNKMLNPVL